LCVKCCGEGYAWGRGGKWLGKAHKPVCARGLQVAQCRGLQDAHGPTSCYKAHTSTYKARGAKPYCELVEVVSLGMAKSSIRRCRRRGVAGAYRLMRRVWASQSCRETRSRCAWGRSSPRTPPGATWSERLPSSSARAGAGGFLLSEAGWRH